MPLTAAQYRVLIPALVGDVGGVVAAQVGDATTAGPLWTLHDDRPTLELQYLYTRRDSISLLMGSVRTKVTKAVGPLRIQYTDLLTSLNTMLTATNADIAKAERQRNAGGVVVGVLTNTAPEAPPDSRIIDRNSSRLLGNPYPGRWPR